MPQIQRKMLESVSASGKVYSLIWYHIILVIFTFESGCARGFRLLKGIVFLPTVAECLIMEEMLGLCK